jgi:hypothetical protein
MVSWRLERVAALLAGFKLLLQLAAIAPYGYCRDELYYLACSEHLALGYVDHPPLSIVVLRIWRAAFGNSVTSIRVVPALAGASLVYITVRTARALGARTPAAALAGLGVVTAPAFFGFDHYFSMNALTMWCGRWRSGSSSTSTGVIGTGASFSSSGRCLAWEP